VTCPACGLTNEDGARVCRNCGLPIASSDDPLRGVKPGHVDVVGARRSGLSAALGLALVIGLLLVGGSLAVSGGGILSSGGRLGVDAVESIAPDSQTDSTSVDAGEQQPGTAESAATQDGGPEDGGSEDGDSAPGTSFAYTCENAAIRDLGGSRWFLSQFRAGERVAEDETYERITWEMKKRGSAKKGTTATMEWTTPREARGAYGGRLVSGNRAIVVTFDGPVDITVGQQIDQLLLEPENVTQIRTIDMFEGEDGNVRTVIGLRGDSCARMSSTGWAKKAKVKNARVYLDVQKP